jgi:hypothetical protein
MFNCLRDKDRDREIRRQSLKDRKQSLEQRIKLINEILDVKCVRVNKLLDERALDIATMLYEGSEITKKMTRLRELEDELVEVIKEQEAMEEAKE